MSGTGDPFQTIRSLIELDHKLLAAIETAVQEEAELRSLIQKETAEKKKLTTLLSLLSDQHLVLQDSLVLVREPVTRLQNERSKLQQKEQELMRLIQADEQRTQNFESESQQLADGIADLDKPDDDIIAQVRDRVRGEYQSQMQKLDEQIQQTEEQTAKTQDAIEQMHQHHEIKLKGTRQSYEEDLAKKTDEHAKKMTRIDQEERLLEPKENGIRLALKQDTERAKSEYEAQLREKKDQRQRLQLVVEMLPDSELR